jgi:ribosome maturation factor RimP
LLANEVTERVWEEVTPELNEQGYELVEVEYVPGARGRVLRLYIDREEGSVTLDDCQRVSRVASNLLDRLDFIDERYVLEVSSPGFDRPVRKASDFDRFTGERIKLVLETAVGGRKRINGILKGYRDGLVTVDSEGTIYEVHIENLKKANLDR